MTENPTAAEADPAIKAQNPDLETAWRTIAWWQQTCDYWQAEAQKGYATRDSVEAIVTAHVTAAEDRMREAVEAAIRLVSPDHITPIGARQIRAALAPTAHDAEV